MGIAGILIQKSDQMKRIFAIALLLSISLIGCSQKKQDNFISLFNGKDLSGWAMPKDVPGFEVKDGIMIAEPPGGSDIFTNEEYANYIFRFEYLLSKVGNSGVLIRCSPENPWGTGVEVQLLAPWTPYRDDLHCTGSIYGYVPVTNRPDETTGVWHEMEIRCDRNIIIISVDGQMTTAANVGMVESMKDKLLSGVIGFQSNHSKQGEFVQLRNISIRNLDSEPEYVAGGFYIEDMRFRQQAWETAKSMGAPVVPFLAKIMEGVNPLAVSGAKQVLFDITARATSPGSEEKIRNELIQILRVESGKPYSQAVTGYLAWLLEMAESVK